MQGMQLKVSLLIIPLICEVESSQKELMPLFSWPGGAYHADWEC